MVEPAPRPTLRVFDGLRASDLLLRADVVTLSDVVLARVAWLWKDRIALGKLNAIVGNAGLGKSTLALEIAARLTTGCDMPDGATGLPVADVVVLSLEDGAADTIKPRLLRASGDSQRVHLLTSVRDEQGSPRLPTLPDNVDIVQALIETVDAKLLIVDPFSAYLSSDVNSWRDADVRRALAPLAKLADDLGIAVLLIIHLSKAKGVDPLHRVAGSIAMGAALRQIILVAEDPHDEDRRLVAQLKSNLAPRAKTLAYTFGVADEWGAAPIEWAGETNHRIRDLLGSNQRRDSALERAKEILRTTLSVGPVLADEAIDEVMTFAHVSERTVNRAKSALGVVSYREGGLGSDGAWFWRLERAVDDA